VVSGSNRDAPLKRGNMNSEQITAYQEIRTSLIDRLKRLQIAPALLEDMPVFQLVNLIFMMAGFLNYTGTFTCTAWTLEEILGKDAFYDKPSEQRAQSAKIESEPKSEPIH
jgi:hypothetical protein